MPLQPAILNTARLNNFRLAYLTPALAGDRPTHIRIILGGIDVTQPTAPIRVLYKSVTIHDLVFDAPNTCAMTLYGAAAPTVGQSLEVWVNSNAPVLLFGGEVQTVERTYKGRPSTVLHPITAIDDTARANRRRPLRPYVNQSATAIAQDLIATYAPGFSSAGVEANLPVVSINFDGSEGGMKGCLTALAKLIGGYWYFEAKTLYLFQTPPGPSPDPIDDTPHRFLHDPAITWTIDKSQVRTRVYGKGASTQISTGIGANTDLVPLVNAEMFNPTGGQAIAGLTPDGAASRVLTYTGVQLGGGGSLIGPGAAPSAALVLSPATGAGIDAGVHAYAYSFGTNAGSSLLSPISTITVGTTPAPASAPIAGAPTGGGAIDTGTHYYAVTFVTASGETTSSAGSAGVTVPGVGGVMAPPATAPANATVQFSGGHSTTWAIGDTVAVAVVYVNANGTTTPGPMSNGVVIVSTDPTNFPTFACPVNCTNIPVSADPSVTGKRLYAKRNGAWVGYFNVANNVTSQIWGTPHVVAPPPETNTATVNNARTVPLSGIAIGPANVTARKLYRYSTDTYRLVATIANNTATTYIDTAANSALGAAAPATNTAAANRVAMTVPIGGQSAITGRVLYRTAANTSQLRVLTIIGDNTTTAYTDQAPDAQLGGNAPTIDDSGLTQPSGQVPAGATAMIVANTAAFATGGGWAVVGNGEQVIRYASKTPNSLTGIPPVGPGALTAAVSYNSTVTGAPALVGVTGVLEAIIRNSPIHVWVQRDDLAAQANMGTLDGGGDGVYEHIWSDERRAEASLMQVCDAQLKLYSRPLTTVVYASRDLKTKSGKAVTIALTTPAINETLTIQDVTISELGIKGLLPKFTVTASNVHTTLESVLRMLIRKADA